MKKKQIGIFAIVCMVLSVAIAVFAEEKASDAVPVKQLPINQSAKVVAPSPRANGIYNQIMQDQERMRQKMDQMFNDPDFMSPAEMNMVRSGGLNYPRTRFMERPDKYVLQTITPGMDKKDISVQLSGNILTIKGGDQSRSDKKTNGTETYRQFSKQFTQSFTVPQDADVSQIKSNYKNGILTVVIPKDAAKAAANVKNIPIE